MNSRKRILIIDGSNAVREMICTFLASDYDTDGTGNAQIAQQYLRAGTHDAVIVNATVQSDAYGGLEFVKKMRAESDQRPVVVITDKPNQDLPAMSYDAGADGFMRLLYSSMQEVLSLLRRLFLTRAFCATPRIDGILLPKETFRFAGVLIHPDLTAVFPRAKKGGVKLRPKEVGILHMLMRHQGTLLKRTELLAEVWGPTASISCKSLDTHFCRLKKTFRHNGVDLTSRLSSKPKVGWFVAGKARTRF